MTDPVIKKMIESGVMDESEAPFENDDNAFDESENESDGIELPYTLELSDPFDFGKEKIKELIFCNRATTAMTSHLPIHGTPKRGHFIPIISGMTGLDDAYIRLVSPRDFMRCIEIAFTFF